MTVTESDTGRARLPSAPHDGSGRYDAVMLDYASGALAPGPAFVVAAHLA
jgi:hypothetical protein